MVITLFFFNPVLQYNSFEYFDKAKLLTFILTNQLKHLFINCIVFVYERYKFLNVFKYLYLQNIFMLVFIFYYIKYEK